MNNRAKVEVEGHKCQLAGTRTAPIVTITKFDHGGSTHETYVECSICGRKSSAFDDYGLFSESSLRNAQEDWNQGNDNLYSFPHPPFI